MEKVRSFRVLKVPRKRLVRNGRLALGIAKTSSGRGGAYFCAAQNHVTISVSHRRPSGHQA